MQLHLFSIIFHTMTTNGKETDTLLAKTNGGSSSNGTHASRSTGRSTGFVALAVGVVALAGFLGWKAAESRHDQSENHGPSFLSQLNQNAVTLPDDFPMPVGVNLGSWLSLEVRILQYSNTEGRMTSFVLF